MAGTRPGVNIFTRLLCVSNPGEAAVCTFTSSGGQSGHVIPVWVLSQPLTPPPTPLPLLPKHPAFLEVNQVTG
ncbi:hypothetical protein INR49_012691 [Caranx melampygus]|nr:hypothetical protein INR49_012691 [Caranx melampygus]